MNWDQFLWNCGMHMWFKCTYLISNVQHLWVSWKALYKLIIIIVYIFMWAHHYCKFKNISLITFNWSFLLIVKYLFLGRIVKEKCSIGSHPYTVLNVSCTHQNDFPVHLHKLFPNNRGKHSGLQMKKTVNKCEIISDGVKARSHQKITQQSQKLVDVVGVFTLIIPLPLVG